MDVEITRCSDISTLQYCRPFMQIPFAQEMNLILTVFSKYLLEYMVFSVPGDLFSIDFPITRAVLRKSLVQFKKGRSFTIYLGLPVRCQHRTPVKHSAKLKSHQATLSLFHHSVLFYQGLKMASVTSAQASRALFLLSDAAVELRADLQEFSSDSDAIDTDEKVESAPPIMINFTKMGEQALSFR